jgi:hypothetical protein
LQRKNSTLAANSLRIGASALEVELPLAKGRRRDSKKLPYVKGKRDSKKKILSFADKKKKKGI